MSPPDVSPPQSRLDATIGQAARGDLYPSVILYGGTQEARRQASLRLARALLCERTPIGGDADSTAEAAHVPCDPAAADACRHCRRVVWPDKGAEHFHPDLHVLERDLRASTSIAATKSFARAAYSAPFEADGQVFVVDEAQTLAGGAADALLKLLEEPPGRSPRHFLLQAPSRLDLSATLRSRSLSVYLGSSEALDPDEIGALAESLAGPIDGWFESRSPLHLLVMAEHLAGGDGWTDPRGRRPWARAAAAVARVARDRTQPAERRQLLDLSAELLDGTRYRLRSIQPARILEGLAAKHLAV